MDSTYMKAALMGYFRFLKQAHFVATECGYFNSDLLVYKAKDLTEVEIKVSFQDFKSDFKKVKHKFFLENQVHESLKEDYFAETPNGKRIIGDNGYYIKLGRRLCDRYKYSKPNFFVFAVPEDLVSKVEPFLKANYPKYGLLAIEEKDIYSIQKNVRVVIRPKRLHKERCHSMILETIAARMSSEIANLRMSEIRTKNGN